MGKSGRTDLEPVGFVGPIRDEIDPKLALGVLYGGIDLALRHAIALGK